MNKTLQLLGLTKKAGKLCAGTDSCLEYLTKNKLQMIFIAKDASFATIDKVERKAFYYECTVNKSFTSEELNNALGLQNIKVVGILDVGFTKAIKKSLLVEVEREIN